MMVENKVRRLVVLDRDKHVVGVLSVDDIAVLSTDEELSGGTTEGFR
jgi:CBS domain-containing protein